MPPPSRTCPRVSLMPIRQFLLIKLGKDVGYAYRARAVEAIHLYRKLEQELVTRYGFKDDTSNVHNLRPGTVQNVDFLQYEGICEKFGNNLFAASS